MFKVGKKYKGMSGRVYDCVWANATHSAMFCPNLPYKSHMVAQESDGYTEYVEPLKGYVNVWRSEFDPNRLPYFGSKVYTDRGEAIRGTQSNPNYIKTIEVTYVPEG